MRLWGDVRLWGGSISNYLFCRVTPCCMLCRVIFFGDRLRGNGAKVENAGNKLGVIFSNVNADCRGWAAPRTTLEGGVIYGLLVSKTTLSGSVSIELILMTGLSILL